MKISQFLFSKFFNRIFQLVADINSGVIFFLLPANVLLLSMSMYIIEHVSRNFIWFDLMNFSTDFELNFILIYFNSSRILIRLSLVWTWFVSFVHWCGHFYFAISEIQPWIMYRLLVILHTIRSGLIIRWNCKNISFLLLYVRINVAGLSDFIWFHVPWKYLHRFWNRHALIMYFSEDYLSIKALQLMK